MVAPENRAEHTGGRVALAGIAASALLATLNIVVGILTKSTSVVATGAEFAGDVLASTVVLIGMVVAVKPADENHPYGHGRAPRWSSASRRRIQASMSVNAANNDTVVV